ncbi:MAG: WbqC family protein [Ktedonobacteraceae bacterium]
MVDKTVAICQPTFLAWAGWFDLSDQVDLLVILDDVGFSKQSWQQRNRVRTATGLTYVTVPVISAGRLGQRIIDVEFADTRFITKITRTISQSYSHARYYSLYFPEFCAVLNESAASGRLAELNFGLIKWISGFLGITTPRVRSSTLDVGGRRGQYVAGLCEKVGASRYISPPGAADYLIEDRMEFEDRSISIALQVYEHPTYRQCFEPFLPYASVLDLLLNEGEAAGSILRSGRRPPRSLVYANGGEANIHAT